MVAEKMQGIHKWGDTYRRLIKDRERGSLEPDAVEELSLAAYLTGRNTEGLQILEQAHQGHLERGETIRAVRCAFWLGLMLLNEGQMARSSGWIARGERLLTNEKDCAEKGLLMIPGAIGALYSGYPEKAQKILEEATAIGEEFGDGDLISLGRLGHGQALVELGHVGKGLSLLDEAMVTVETDEVLPVVNGIVYCAVIETCRKVWDLRRAQEWTSAFTRWCEAHPDIVPFRGQCLVRRAEMIQFHGEWLKALDETGNACDLLTRPPGEPAAGEAYYRRAELYRLLGDNGSAEDSYHEAAKWGRSPQPGLALLRLAQGHSHAAETSIRNTLQEAQTAKKRAELLPAVVSIMVAAKQTGEAREASEELYMIAREFDVPYLHAMSAYCKGAVLFADGDAQPALDHLHKASNVWNTLHLPYESARTRELKGLIYRELNDNDNSDTELTAAKWLFEQLQATPDVQRVNRSLNAKRHHETYGLTLRELQVLRLVAFGKSNKSIADELFISERTVDRHVSNIFSKLVVSSRTEATSFALKNRILDR